MQKLGRTFLLILSLGFGFCPNVFATYITHDWTVRINGHDYGLQGIAELTNPPESRTIVYYSADATGYWIINLPVQLVAFMFLGFVFAVVVAGTLFVRSYSRRKSPQK